MGFFLMESKWPLGFQPGNLLKYTLCLFKVDSSAQPLHFNREQLVGEPSSALPLWPLGSLLSLRLSWACPLRQPILHLDSPGKFYLLLVIGLPFPPGLLKTSIRESIPEFSVHIFLQGHSCKLLAVYPVRCCVVEPAFPPSSHRVLAPWA